MTRKEIIRLAEEEIIRECASRGVGIKTYYDPRRMIYGYQLDKMGGRMGLVIELSAIDLQRQSPMELFMDALLNHLRPKLTE